MLRVVPEKWVQRAGEALRSVLSAGLVVAGLGSCGVGVWQFLRELLGWAQRGDWTSVRSWRLVQELGDGSVLKTWLLAPDSWLGIHGIVSGFFDFPLWFAAILGGLTLVGIGPEWAVFFLGIVGTFAEHAIAGERRDTTTAVQGRL